MAILFDLDGTLLDTSFDLHDAVNALLIQEKRSPISYAEIRPLITFGGKAILAHAFNLNLANSSSDMQYLATLIPRFLQLYRQTDFVRTKAFPGVNKLLADIENLQLPWGIVTNKMHALTEPLLKAVGYFDRSACVVSGDTTNYVKPHPEPLHYACNLLKVKAQNCIYIGDSESDIQAGKAAGMQTIAVAFGFIPAHVSISTWQADYNVNTADEILPWIKKWSEKQI